MIIHSFQNIIHYFGQKIKTAVFEGGPGYAYCWQEIKMKTAVFEGGGGEVCMSLTRTGPKNPNVWCTITAWEGGDFWWLPEYDTNRSKGPSLSQKYSPRNVSNSYYRESFIFKTSQHETWKRNTKIKKLLKKKSNL